MAKPDSIHQPLTPDEQRLAKMLKALGNPVRFQIVQVLAEKQVCITGEIVELTRLAQSTVSQHLKVLREAGLIAGEFEGPATCYCLNHYGILWLKEQVGNWLPDCCREPMSMTPASSKYFEQVAGEWDNLRSGFFSEAVRETAIAKAYLRPEMVAADVGAGTGFMAAGLAPLIQHVHVLDGSPAMLEVARKNLSAFTNIEYHRADVLLLPLREASVDVVFANMLLHHCPDPLAAIQEMVSVLKPGGRLVITDVDVHPYTWLKEEMADVWMGFERDQVRAWFKDTGLVNVMVDCTGQSCCAETHEPQAAVQHDRPVNISVFVASGTRRVAMREKVKDAYSAAAQGACDCSGMQEPASAACCSDSPQSKPCCSEDTLTPNQAVNFATAYSPEERAAVPPEAEEISLGCGNPLALANLRPGEVVLDIGSGGGMDSFLAAGRVGPTGRAIGVDMTPAMLARARATALKAGISNVEFRQGQAESLPVEDGSVDVILSNCVINLCEDKGQVFREAYRVLKPGGRLEVSDVVTSGALPLELRQDAGEWAGCVSGALPEQEYLDLIAQAGFTNVTTRRSTSSGETGGVSVYSVIASARKPAP
jgi:ubiquinone/menaquinone biosynthesis C-methylase UbiE/DNA-binding transcriptional ArsR family regulator